MTFDSLSCLCVQTLQQQEKTAQNNNFDDLKLERMTKMCFKYDRIMEAEADMYIIVQLCKTRRHKSLQVMQLQAGTCRPQSAQCTAVLQTAAVLQGGGGRGGNQGNAELTSSNLRLSSLATCNTSLDTVLCNLVHTSMSSINHGPVTATHHICYSGWIYPGLHNQCGSVVIPSSDLGAGPDSVLAPWACTQHGSSPSTAALRYQSW